MVGKFYRIINNLYTISLPDHLEYGYEYEGDFRHVLWKMIDTWKNRVGECIDEHNEHLRLRFHDTPGGKLDEVWLPAFLLVEELCPPAMPDEPSAQDEITAELDSIFDFS